MIRECQSTAYQFKSYIIVEYLLQNLINNLVEPRTDSKHGPIDYKSIDKV